MSAVESDAPHQVMPDLDAETYAALTDSIRTYGVITPIVVSQNGEIIDGHNRWRIANELNVTCPSEVREVADEAEALDIARTLNLDRRHIDKAARVPLAQSLREKGHSLRAIAGALGVDPKTVRKDLGEAEPINVGNGSTPGSEPSRVTGKDGKSYPTTKPVARTLEQRAELLDEYEVIKTDAEKVAAMAAAYVFNTPKALRMYCSQTRKLLAAGETPIDKLARLSERDRVEQIVPLAAEGHTSRQIGKTIGVSDEQVRIIARKNNITIPADEVVGKTRRLDPNRIVEETVISLDGIVMSLELVEEDGLNRARCAEWATSLSESLRLLKRFNTQLKEMARDEE